MGKREDSCGVLVMGSLPVASCFFPQSCGGWEEELGSACGSKREARGVSRLVIVTAGSRSCSMLTRGVDRAFIASSAPLRGDCSIGARVFCFSAVGD